LSDDVTLHTKKAIWLLKELNCVQQRNQLKNHSKKESILAPPRINSSINQNFPLLIPKHTLNHLRMTATPLVPSFNVISHLCSVRALYGSALSLSSYHALSFA